MHSIKGKFDLTFIGLLQYSDIQKYVYISMYCFYVSAQTTRCLTN